MPRFDVTQKFNIEVYGNICIVIVKFETIEISIALKYIFAQCADSNRHIGEFLTLLVSDYCTRFLAKFSYFRNLFKTCPLPANLFCVLLCQIALLLKLYSLSHNVNI